MSRRGQLTLFLVLGLVVLLVFLFAFNLRSRFLEAKIRDESVVAADNPLPPIRFNLETTLKNAATTALLDVIAPQGGYRDPATAQNNWPLEYTGPPQVEHPGPPPQYKKFTFEMNYQDEPVRFQIVTPHPGKQHPAPYYYLLGKFSYPSLDRIRQELLNETIKRFNDTMNLSVFEKKGGQLIYPDEPPFINLTINYEDITATLQYPIQARLGHEVDTLPDITVYLPLRMNRSYALMECLVNRVVYDEGMDTTDPYNEDPTRAAFRECKQQLKLDDNFTARFDEIKPGGTFKGRLVRIEDGKYRHETGTPFEYQYLIWKCSGSFTESTDEQKMRVCENACAYEIPEVVLLGLCTRESNCNHWKPAIPTVKETEDGGVGIMQLTGTICKPSIIDRKALDEQDLEDNVECGAQELDSYSGFKGRYCCPFKLLAGGEQIYHICCVNPEHPCCKKNDQERNNDPCCVDARSGQPFRDLASKDYPPYDPCEWIDHHDRIPNTNPVEYNDWRQLQNPPFCCDPDEPAYRKYCCERVPTGPAPGWPATDAGSVLPDAYFIYDNEQIDGTGLSGITKDAYYTGPSWDGALRAYNGWGCEANHQGDGYQADKVTCALENYVDAVHRFGYDERTTCRSIRSTPARVGGSVYNEPLCCPIGASAQPCKEAQGGKNGWPSWP